MSRPLAELAEEIEETTAQAESLMENIGRRAFADELSARGLHPENLTDAQLDEVAEAIASGQLDADT